MSAAVAPYQVACDEIARAQHDYLLADQGVALARGRASTDVAAVVAAVNAYGAPLLGYIPQLETAATEHPSADPATPVLGVLDSMTITCAGLGWSPGG